MAESLINRWGAGKFRGFSAGSVPVGTVHPIALELLEHLGMGVQGLRSKSWDEFAGPHAPHLDFVFTVCDKAANETCPAWTGQPMTAHWSIPDPAAVTGDASIRWLAFRDAFRMLENRIKLFVNLPIAALDRMTLRLHLEEIGKSID